MTQNIFSFLCRKWHLKKKNTFSFLPLKLNWELSHHIFALRESPASSPRRQKINNSFQVTLSIFSFPFQYSSAPIISSISYSSYKSEVPDSVFHFTLSPSGQFVESISPKTCATIRLTSSSFADEQHWGLQVAIILSTPHHGGPSLCTCTRLTRGK